MVDNTEKDRLTVLLTGFSKFENVSTNPSEVLVRQLADEGIVDVIPDVHLITEIVPVEYETADCIIPKFWEEHKPDLVIHFGVHTESQAVSIECASKRRGYCHVDVNRKCPPENCCPFSSDEDETLMCGLNCERIVEEVSKKIDDNSLEVSISNDPGRYLCGYVYFISLSIDKERCLFVHIPDFCSGVTTKSLLVKVAKEIVNAACSQIKQLKKQLRDIS